MATVQRPAPWTFVLVAVGLAVGLGTAACDSAGNGDTGSATSTSPAATTAAATSSPSPSDSDQCADVTALRDSVQSLTDVTVQQGMAEELRANLADTQEKLTALVENARTQYQDETAALESALGAVGTALQAFAANPGTETASAVTSALRQVDSAWTSLSSAVGSRCPLLSASPTTS